MTDTIHLYGDIGDSFWFEGITAKDVVLSLKELDSGVNKHIVKINSPGGYVDEGLAIMNVLLAHKRTMKTFNDNFQLETVVDGYCMSAATCPFMAGDVRRVALGGVVMIHEAWSGVYGNAAEMTKQADVLNKLSENAAKIYASLCTPAGKGEAVRDAAFYRNLMMEETYMIGSEAKDFGLATDVDEENEAVLIAELSPENMKGHYVEYMTSRRTHTVLQRPTNKQTKMKMDTSIKALEALAAELNLEFPKQKA